MARRELGTESLRVVQAVANGIAAVPANSKIRLACSGGPDSLAMAAAVAHLMRRGRISSDRVEAMVVDHGLQEGSAEVAEAASKQLTKMGFQTEISRVHVPEDSGLGPEAAAREARYAALGADLGSGTPDVLMLGHTMDDQAESVLMGLARGSGIRSLSGMTRTSAQDPILLRPMLGLRRATTEGACREWRITPWQDPHNVDPRYLRSRVRMDLMPVLTEVLGPGAIPALARTAELARADADELDEQALKLVSAMSEYGEDFPCEFLEGLPSAIASRVLRGWLFNCGVAELDLERTRAVLELIEDWHGQKGVEVPGNWTIVRERGRLRCIPTEPME